MIGKHDSVDATKHLESVEYGSNDSFNTSMRNKYNHNGWKHTK